MRDDDIRLGRPPIWVWPWIALLVLGVVLALVIR